jgi:hypothetical protein
MITTNNHNHMEEALMASQQPPASIRRGQSPAQASDPARRKVYKGQRGWDYRKLDFSAIDHPAVAQDELLFYLLMCGSFVEIMSDLYTSNLVRYYEGEADLLQWLQQTWEPEEIQHGQALRAYVQAVWPQVDWQQAFDGFCAEYAPLCNDANLEPSKALEMAARCIVETGTSSFYRALFNYATEPVLCQLLANIKADEVRHFKYFYSFFQRFNQREGNSPRRVAAVLWRRIREIRNEDTKLAYKYAYRARCGHDMSPGDFERFHAQMRRWAKQHYPYRMAFEMATQPLPLPQGLKRLMTRPAVALLRAAAL